jgi:hypothetical protein
MSAAQYVPRYKSGEEINAGDLIRVERAGDAAQGRVLVVIDTAKAVDGYEASEWAYLGTGVMVEVKEIGLVHFIKPHEELVLERRT